MKKITKKLLTATSTLFAAGCLVAFPVRAMGDSSNPPPTEFENLVSSATNVNKSLTDILSTLEQLKARVESFPEDCAGRRDMLEDLLGFIETIDMWIKYQQESTLFFIRANRSLTQKALACGDIEDPSQRLDRFNRIQDRTIKNFMLQDKTIWHAQRAYDEACNAVRTAQNWLTLQMNHDQAGAAQTDEEDINQILHQLSGF